MVGVYRNLLYQCIVCINHAYREVKVVQVFATRVWCTVVFIELLAV